MSLFGLAFVPYYRYNKCVRCDKRKEVRNSVYQILKKQTLNANTKLMVIDAPHVARKAEPGQFIILRVSEDGERIPLTIADFDREKGSVTIIFQEVGVPGLQSGI